MQFQISVQSCTVRGTRTFTYTLKYRSENGSLFNGRRVHRTGNDDKKEFVAHLTMMGFVFDFVHKDFINVPLKRLDFEFIRGNPLENLE